MRNSARSGALAGLLAIIAAFGLGLPHSNDVPRATRLHPTGAMQALSHWANQRAYPARDLPKRGYLEAFSAAKRMQAAPDTARSSRKGWRALGPHNFGGRTLALAFNPLNPNTLWAGTASGGLWRSETGGVGPDAWHNVPTSYPVLGVAAVAVAPDDSNVIYIGTGEVYQYGNATGGITVRLARGSYGIGILKSADGGASWTQSLDWTADQRRGVQVIRIDPLAPQIVWAGTTEGTYRSWDAGLSWQFVHDVVMVTDIAISPIEPNRVVIACGNFASTGHGIYRTEDGGDTWTKCSQPGVLPAVFAGKAQLARCATAPQVILASIGNGGQGSNATWLCRSDDGGVSWALASNQDYAQYQGWFSHDVGVNPQNPSLVLAAGIDIWKSTTGGGGLVRKSDWTAWYFGQTPVGGPEGPPHYAHADHHDIVYHPVNPDIVYIAGDGGVFRSLNGGETFEGCNGGFQTQQFYPGFACSPRDPQHALGGMQDNATAIYAGSPAWIRVIGGDGAWAAIDPQNDDILLGSAQYLQVFRSTNRGQSWLAASPVNSGVTGFVAPLAMAGAGDPQIAYAGRSIVFRSVTGGASWFATNNGLQLDGNPALAIAVSQQDANVVYVTTAPVNWPAGVWRSDNGGQIWTNVTGALPNRYHVGLTLDPADDRTVYVAVSGFGTSHLYRSTSGGGNWQDIGTGLPDVPTSSVAVDPIFRQHLYVGNDLGVFRSLDSGASWHAFSDDLPDAVIAIDLEISPADRMLRLATHGNGVYERSLMPTYVGVPGALAAETFRLGPIGPNPAHPTTRIAFELFADADVELIVYDVRGRLVRNLLRDRFAAGSHAVTWDGRDARGAPSASGVYLCRLRAADRTDTRPITLAR